MSSIKTQARRAGVLYLLACLPGPFCLIYVPNALIVAGDATATADRVRASETLLRLGIACELLSAILFIFAVLAFYRLFKAVDGRLASAMVALVLVSIPISMLNALNNVAALILVGGAKFLATFGRGQLDSLAYFFLRLHGSGVIVAQIFWGLWLFPYGMLAMKSGFIPRILGILVMFAGFGYLAISFAAVLLPHYVNSVSRFALFLAIGELPMMLWLLIWGAKTQASRAPGLVVGGATQPIRS